MAPRRGGRRIGLSIDEWNVWHLAEHREREAAARGPRLRARARAGRGHPRPRRRAGRRLPADHAAAPRRPRVDRLPGPARQRHPGDPDRRRRPAPGSRPRPTRSQMWRAGDRGTRAAGRRRSRSPPGADRGDARCTSRPRGGSRCSRVNRAAEPHGARGRGCAASDAWSSTGQTVLTRSGPRRREHAPTIPRRVDRPTRRWRDRRGRAPVGRGSAAALLECRQARRARLDETPEARRQRRPGR